MSHSTKVDRKTLYDQVWRTPMRTLAKEYGVSDVALSKVCRKMGIPTPGVGYWAKLQHGKVTGAPPPLPPLKPTQVETSEVSRTPASPVAGHDVELDEMIVSEQSPERKIIVSEQLRNPHPSVREAAQILEKAATDHHGMRHTVPGAWNRSSIFKIRVSSASRNRALRLLDTLVKAFEARGYEISKDGVIIEGQHVSFALDERENKTLHIPTNAEKADKARYQWTRIRSWDYSPNGKLSIYTHESSYTIGDLSRRWSDGRTTCLEDMLNDVVIGLLAIGNALRKKADELAREEVIRAERRRQQVERERQARMEKARRENLAATTSAWAQAQKIRAFACEVERQFGDDERLIQWLKWAAAVATDIDPLSAGPEKLIDSHAEAADRAGAEEPTPSWARWQSK